LILRQNINQQKLFPTLTIRSIINNWAPNHHIRIIRRIMWHWRLEIQLWHHRNKLYIYIYGLSL